MNIAILIPTYNEGDIIEELLGAVVFETNKIKNHSFSILVIDGNSTDGTIEKIKKVMMGHGNVNYIVEEKKGLGRAYLKGIAHIQTADAFMEFDGDFQHDPKDIITLIRKLDEGYDYVIGSRYIKNGSVPIEWPWYRKWFSLIGGRASSLVLQLSITDSTSGFKLTRLEFYKKHVAISSADMISFRHAYKIHFLYLMIKRGAKTIEVPIHFLHRRKGVSKISFKDFSESCRVLVQLVLRGKF